jgi:rubrerythrin
MHLGAIAAAVLLLGLQGCCPDQEREFESDHEGIVAADLLETIRADYSTGEERCDAACIAIAMEEDTSLDEVRSCTAEGEMMTQDPWDQANSRVTVTCTGVFTSQGFCTGRRPQGHHEGTQAVTSVGTWLAVHAHLEQASVRAFEELAAWLEVRGAPAELVSRCRAASEDETLHAGLMTHLARQRGATVEPCHADAPSDGVLQVALHNAVEGCVHEAFASIVAMMQARRAEDPGHREVFERIATDEVAHGQLAWDLHAWLLQQLGHDERALVQAAQRKALRHLPETAAANAAATPAALGWPAPELARRMASSFAASIRSGLHAGQRRHARANSA